VRSPDRMIFCFDLFFESTGRARGRPPALQRNEPNRERKTVSTVRRHTTPDHRRH
jgi:hypothetical protein